MSGDTTRGTGDEPSLERIREASDAVEKSTMAVVAEKVYERWQTAGAVVVLALTTVALYYIDGGLSLDAQIFGGITVVLLLYFLQTLRTDVSME